MTKKIPSWTGIPPQSTGNSAFRINGFLSVIILAGTLGIAFGSTPIVFGNKSIGDQGLTGSVIPFVTHTEVWPKQKVVETFSERLDRLDLKILQEHVPEVVVEPTPKNEEPTTKEMVKPVGEKPPRINKGNTAKVIKVDPVPVKEGSPSSPMSKPKEVTHETEVPLPTQTDRLLIRIRKDSSRIYIDKEFVFGDLTWCFRNATDEGIEVLVTNDGNSTKTYYLPKATVGGIEALLEGSVLSPGQTLFGAIPVSGLKSKKEITIALQAVGFGEKKVKVNLQW